MCGTHIQNVFTVWALVGVAPPASADHDIIINWLVFASDRTGALPRRFGSRMPTCSAQKPRGDKWAPEINRDDSFPCLPAGGANPHMARDSRCKRITTIGDGRGREGPRAPPAGWTTRANSDPDRHQEAAGRHLATRSRFLLQVEI